MSNSALPISLDSTQVRAITAPQKSLADCESLLGLFSVFQTNDALKVSNWSVGEEIKLLTDIARGISDCEADRVDMATRARAAKELRVIARQVLAIATAPSLSRGPLKETDDEDDEPYVPPLTSHVIDVTATATPQQETPDGP